MVYKVPCNAVIALILFESNAWYTLVSISGILNTTSRNPALLAKGISI
jgi:hypothetical protein